MLGDNFLIMNCNGKVYPIMSECKFDLAVYGTDSKARFIVKAKYNNERKQMGLNGITQLTKDARTQIL